VIDESAIQLRFKALILCLMSTAGVALRRLKRWQPGPAGEASSPSFCAGCPFGVQEWVTVMADPQQQME
jgi:hypothetical protein